MGDFWGSLQLDELLLELYKFHHKPALNEVMKLASSDYGGFTYKSELQNVASLAAFL